MKVAVVGAGVAGLVAAHRLQGVHEVTLFEAEPRLGGHTHTVELEEDGRPLAVDTGFIVFNRRNYPRFTALLHELDIDHHPSDMSFSVRDERTGLEYRGSSLNTLFAQRRNLVRPAFHRMIRDIVRFYGEAASVPGTDEADLSLGEYVERHRYGRLFVEDHILPMAAALWSSPTEGARDIPMGFLIRFLDNHGMMRFRGRPEWRVVTGGSHAYVRAIAERFTGSVRTATPVEGVRREVDGVLVKPRGHDWLRFDRVVLALHADQALRILDDPDPRERAVLGAIRFRANDVVLHTDTLLLPRRRRAWSSWNYHVLRRPVDGPTVTYSMNRLQGFRARREFLVTLNRTGDIAPGQVLRRFNYRHPIFDRGAVEAQAAFGTISGHRGTHYCGAYWGFGFHEDGVRSAERVVRALDPVAVPV